MNVLYLPELCEWYNSENFDSWWINVVWGPSHFCVTNMPPAAKKLVLDRLTGYDFGKHQSQIEVIISLIQNSNIRSNPEFINNIRKIDLTRNQDLRLAHAGIANAMGYVL